MNTLSKHLLTITIIIGMLHSFSVTAQQPLIVGLVQVRNEEHVITDCLRCLAPYVDAIVVLNDGSTDRTQNVLESLVDQLPIARIIVHNRSGWETHSEAVNRQKLLDAGRAIGGTHFVLIDADEIFSARCMHDNWLRNQLMALIPGQVLTFPMVNVWGGIDQYRDDSQCSPHEGFWQKKPIAFCDDGKGGYVGKDSQQTEFLHGSRVPCNMHCASLLKKRHITDLNHCVIHFKWANLDNISVKKAWYMAIEYLHALHISDIVNVHVIKSFYNNVEFKGMHANETNIVLKPVPATWYAYDNFDPRVYQQFHEERIKDLERWVQSGKLVCLYDQIKPVLFQYNAKKRKKA